MADSTTIYDGKKVTTTLSGIRVQTACHLGLPLNYPEKSTINEHLSVFKDVMPDAMARPTAKYLVLGNKGHKVTEQTDDLQGVVPVTHQPTDAAPYGIIPLVLRPVDKDLADDVRDRYALRRLETHNNVRYWAYYARRLAYPGKTVTDYYTKVRDGVSTVNEFKYTDLNLHPTQPDLTDYNFDVTDTVVASDGDYVNTAATIDIKLDAFDIAELINVAKVKYQNPTLAIVSEFCLCTGVDTVATGESFMGSPFTYEEVAGCQVSLFLTTFINVAFNNGGVGYTVSMGQTEPFALATGQIASGTTIA